MILSVGAYWSRYKTILCLLVFFPKTYYLENVIRIQRYMCAAESLKSRPVLCGLMDCIGHQAPPSMGFSRQTYWSGLLCPSPVDLPDPGDPSHVSYVSCFVGRFFTTSATWEGTFQVYHVQFFLSEKLVLKKMFIIGPRII